MQDARLAGGPVEDEELAGLGGAGEPADGVAGQAEPGGDCSLAAARRARRAFSPREAWKIEIDFDSDKVRSKNNGLCRAFLTASVRSSRLRSAVACGSAARS